MWYGLASLSGAELYGIDAMPGGNGLSYLKIAQNTYDQVWQQWDTEQCQGGIYWSRDRTNAKSKGYKSTITNAQHIMMGARLHLLTGNVTYVENSRKTYKWLRQGLIRNGHVADGVDGDQGCGMNNKELSYKSGMTMGALAWLFKATNDQNYLNDAGEILKVSLAMFSINGVITDPCERSFNCSKNAVQSKGTMIRGIGYLAMFTTIKSDKTLILKALAGSVNAMLKTCDAAFNCGDLWNAGTKGSNFHWQIDAFELINAFGAAKFSLGSAKLKNPIQVSQYVDDEDGALPNSLFLLYVAIIFWTII